MNKEVKETIKEIIKRMAYKKGWYQPMIDRNLLLILEEVEEWVESLSSTVQQPFLENCTLDEIRGLLMIDISHLGFSFFLMDKPRSEKAKAILRSLSSYYLKNRRLKVDHRMFYPHVFTDDYMEIWIPLNNAAKEEITALIKDRKSKHGKSLEAEPAKRMP